MTSYHFPPAALFEFSFPELVAVEKGQQVTSEKWYVILQSLPKFKDLQAHDADGKEGLVSVTNGRDMVMLAAKFDGEYRLPVTFTFVDDLFETFAALA